MLFLPHIVPHDDASHGSFNLALPQGLLDDLLILELHIDRVLQNLLGNFVILLNTLQLDAERTNFFLHALCLPRHCQVRSLELQVRSHLQLVHLEEFLVLALQPFDSLQVITRRWRFSFVSSRRLALN